MIRERFAALVEDALHHIPRPFRDALENVAVIVEDEPSAELLDEMEMDEDEVLFGLYQGIPLPELWQRPPGPDRYLSESDRGGVRR
jgi:predicted Zn-dependent protease with MMP-like domain